MTTNWLDTDEYPFTPHYFSVNEHQLHYIDEGKGETLLFVHGTPSWSFDFRHLIKVMRTQYRCIAIDHMGFGLSDNLQIIIILLLITAKHWKLLQNSCNWIISRW